MMHKHLLKKVLAVLKLQGITVVAATKGRSVEQIHALKELGIAHIGESYIQEAEEKKEQLKGSNFTWHGIGHVQSNKAKKANALFDTIDTIDSISLAEKVQGPVLLQVNISREEQKHGCAPEEVGELLKKMQALPNLECQGLMMIGSKEQSEKEFAAMKKLFDTYKKQYGLTRLSMGMSDSYQQAIAHGATEVRLGRILFE